MVLVASSRSASTALPREQNQPGRRLAQAAQPTGACRHQCFCVFWIVAGNPMSAMVLPVCRRRKASGLCGGSLSDLQNSRRGEGLRPPGKRAFASNESAARSRPMDVMGLTCLRPNEALCFDRLSSVSFRLPKVVLGRRSGPKTRFAVTKRSFCECRLRYHRSNCESRDLHDRFTRLCDM